MSDPKRRYFERDSTRQPASGGLHRTNVIRGNNTIVTSNYNATRDDANIICNSASAIIITLPNAAGEFSKISISNINIGLVMVKGTGSPSQTIDSEATQSLYQWESFTVIDYIINKWKII
jgi:hypothetical protein